MAPKRQREESDEELDEIIKLAVKEALRKQREPSSAIHALTDLFMSSPKVPPVAEMVNELAGDIIHNGEIFSKELLQGGDVLQYTFDVRFPNTVPVSLLESLHAIHGIVRTHVENIASKEGVLRVFLTYTLDTKLEMRFRKDEQALVEKREQERAIEGTDTYKTVIRHIKENIQIDASEEVLQKGEKAIGEGILLVSIGQAIRTPVRLEQLQRLRHHPLIRDVALVAHPKADKVRVILDFLKEKPEP